MLMRYSTLIPGLTFTNRYTTQDLETLYQLNNTKRSNQDQRNFRMQHKNMSTATYSSGGETWRRETAWKPYEYKQG
jgi:hypothetical protein